MIGLYVLAIVATPFVFAAWLINRIFEHRARMRQLEAARYVQPAALPADPQVEARLANLEAIVCDVDYDLAQRMRRIDGGRAA